MIVEFLLTLSRFVQMIMSIILKLRVCKINKMNKMLFHVALLQFRCDDIGAVVISGSYCQPLPATNFFTHCLIFL